MVLTVVIACASPNAAAAPGVAGVWVVNSDPTPPAAGSAAGLFFEYIPSTGSGPGADPFAGVPPWVVATCGGCGVTVEGTAKLYPSLAPEELYDPRATAAYSVRLMLPRAGTWSISPFGVSVVVRDVDSFEPPLVHVRGWSTPLRPGCGRPEIAALVRNFVDAYNVGDETRLADLVQESINFSIAGAAVPFIATDRTTFLAGIAARHRAREQLTVSTVYVADQGYSALAMEIRGTRNAADVPGLQRIDGKAAMWCSQHQFIHLNLGAF